MSQQGWMKKMKERWGLGPLGVVAVLAAFSLAGSSALFVSRPVLGWVLPDDSPTWLRIIGYLLLMLPIYQVLLLGWGTLLGQFGFFWKRQKELGRLLLRLIGRRGTGGEEES